MSLELMSNVKQLNSILIISKREKYANKKIWISESFWWKF